MRKILLVDDDATTTLVLDAMLSEEGFDVSVVNDSRKTVDAARETQPDVILLDLMMPGIDGIEVCKLLRAESQFEKTPILFFTAIGDLDYKSAAYQAGADDFLVKPIHPKELIARIKKVSKGRE